MEFGGNSPRPRRRRGCRVQNAVRCRSRWSLLDSSRQRRHRSRAVRVADRSRVVQAPSRRYQCDDAGSNRPQRCPPILRSGWRRSPNWILIRSGEWPSIRQAGFDAFRERVAEIDPRVGSTMAVQLDGFRDTSLLDVAPGIADSWSRDGLLLIGDAAHTASPIGAQGNPLAVEGRRRRTVFSSRNSLARTEFSNAKPSTNSRFDDVRTSNRLFRSSGARDQSRVLARVRSLCPSTPRSWDDEGGQGDCPSFEVGAEHDRNVRTRSTFGFGRPISLH